MWEEEGERIVPGHKANAPKELQSYRGVVKVCILFAVAAFSMMYVSQMQNPYSWYWAGRGLNPLPSGVSLDPRVEELMSLGELESKGGKAKLCVSYIASHRRHNQGYLIHSLNSLVDNAATRRSSLPPLAENGRAREMGVDLLVPNEGEDGPESGVAEEEEEVVGKEVGGGDGEEELVLGRGDVFYNVLDAELCLDNQHAEVVEEKSPVLVYRPPVYSKFKWPGAEGRKARVGDVPGLHSDRSVAEENVAHLGKDTCRSAFRLQTLDYAYSVYANAHWCEYTLAIEDDAFAAPGWDVKSLAVAYELDGKDPTWLSAKLYYPSNWGAGDAPFLLAVAGQAGLWFALFVRIWLLKSGRGSVRSASLVYVFLVVFGGAVVFGAIRLSSKQALFPLPAGTYPIRNGMVTSAYLFNNANVESVVRYWRITAHDGEAKDTAYNSYLHSPMADPFTTYMHVPHLFQHVGFNSATQHPISEAEFRTRKMSNVFDGEFVL